MVVFPSVEISLQKMSILLILVYSILTFWGALTDLCWLLIGWILGKQ